MYKKILIATDGSALAHKAVEQGLSLAKEIGATVIAVHVKEPFSFPILEDGAFFAGKALEAYDKDCHINTERILHKVKEDAEQLGVQCITVYVDHIEAPSQGIIETAKKEHCDLIVMSSHGHHGIQGLLLGSQAVDVLTHSHIPVLVCR